MKATCSQSTIHQCCSAFSWSWWRTLMLSTNCFSSLASGVGFDVVSPSKAILTKLVIIPIVFLLLWLPSAVNRVYRSQGYANVKDDAPYGIVLVYVFVLTFPSAGSLNASIYVFSDPDVRRDWMHYICCQRSFEQAKSTENAQTSVWETNFTTPTEWRSSMVTNGGDGESWIWRCCVGASALARRPGHLPIFWRGGKPPCPCGRRCSWCALTRAL